MCQRSPPAQAPQPQTPEDWEHQFKSLKGRYDRDSEDKRNMARQLQETQRLLASLSVAPRSPTRRGNEGSGVRFAAPPPPGRKITPQEVTEYGNELSGRGCAPRAGGDRAGSRASYQRA